MPTAKQGPCTCLEAPKASADPPTFGNAVKVMRIATGDYGPDPESEGKDPAVVALGRKGGQA